ncbi:MAG: cytochrome P450 [Pseudomonadota bacterium]
MTAQAQPQAVLTDADYARLLTDPYPVYRQLQAAGAPIFAPQLDAWLLSGFEAVDSAARDARLVRSRETLLSAAELAAEQRAANWHNMPNHEAFVQFSLLETDGDVHFRLRRLLLGAFTRRTVAQHRAMIEAFVDQLLPPLLEAGRIDFIEDLAAAVPGHIIGRVLGVPDADCPQLRGWSEAIVQYFDVERTAQRKARAERATAEFADYLRTLITARQRRPEDDLISLLVAAEAAGELNRQELISTAMLILMAGHGSTINVLGTGLLALLKQPAHLKRLHQEPALLPTAVQEMFRYESPLPYFHRFAAEDLRLLGQDWPAGTRFGLLYGAANRDPAVFPDADTFRVDRQPNRHLAFGRGAHLCLGNHLSRLDMEIIFERLLARTAHIELLDPNPSYRESLTARGLTALPIHLHAA